MIFYQKVFSLVSGYTSKLELFQDNLKSAVENYKNQEYENAKAFIFRALGINDSGIKWYETIYAKFLLVITLEKLDCLKEANELAQKIIEVAPSEISFSSSTFFKSKIALSPQALSVKIFGLATFNLYRLHLFLEQEDNILHVSEKSQQEFSYNLLKYIRNYDLENSRKSSETEITKITKLKPEQYNIKYDFILTKAYAEGAYYDQLARQKLALLSAKLCPKPRNLDEAICIASGYIVNELYQKAAQILIPFIKSQKDANLVFISDIPRSNGDKKTKVSNMFFNHAIKLTKILLQSKDFIFKEMAYYWLGKYYTTNIYHPDLSPKDKDKNIELAIKYLTKAKKTKKLPPEFIKGISGSIVFNKQLLKGFPALKKEKNINYNIK